MAFAFRYEALLFYKQHLKEKAEIELSLSQRRLRECRELLQEYKEGLWQIGSDLGVGLKAKMPSHIVKNHSDYMESLKTKIEFQEMEIIRAERVVAEKLNNLLAKTKQYKIFEKLKEKDCQKWSHQQYLLEQKETNETAVLRHGKGFLEN